MIRTVHMSGGSIWVGSALLLTVSSVSIDAAERTRDGYLGPVQSVRTERAEMSHASGQWVEGPRILSKVEKYDREGVRIERTEYTTEGSLWYRERHSQDTDGTRINERVTYYRDGTPREKRTHRTSPEGLRVSEVLRYDPDGSIASEDLQSYDPHAGADRGPSGRDGPPTHKIVPSVDKQGRKVIERIEYNVEGAVEARWVQIYGIGGRLVESFDYGSDNSLIRRSVFSQDPLQRLTGESRYRGDGTLELTSSQRTDASGTIVDDEKAVYRLDGTLQSRLTRRFNLHGHLIASTAFDAANGTTVCMLYDYSYDQVGNWIKQTRSRSSSPKIFSEMMPTEVIYRIIVYFDD